MVFECNRFDPEYNLKFNFLREKLAEMNALRLCEK